MNKLTPDWAFQVATPEDWSIVSRLHPKKGVQWTLPAGARLWGNQQKGWPNPWFGWEAAFIAHAVATPENFRQVLSLKGVVVRFPKAKHIITAATLAKWDASYDARGETGRPTDWGFLVEELRELRRAIEAGVSIELEGENRHLKGESAFYEWVSARYHMLEDGYDKWVGNDD